MATETLSIAVRVYNGSSWSTMSSSSAGYVAFGKLDSGACRGIEISFTPTNGGITAFDVRVPQCVAHQSGGTATSGNHTWYYRITTTKATGAPNSVSGTVASGSKSVYSNVNSYANAQFNISVSATPNTKYYFYLYTTTPTGQTVGYINYPKAYSYYKEYTLYAPISCTYTGTAGFCNGDSTQTPCAVQVRTSTSYPYIYARDSATGIYSYKGKASSGYLTVPISMSSSTSNYITKYFTACDTELETVSVSSSSEYNYERVPRIVCSIYNGSSTPTFYNTRDNSNLLSALKRSGYDECIGITTSSTSRVAEYTGWSEDLDGNVIGSLYAINFKEGSTSNGGTYYYYLGNSKNSTTQTIEVADKYAYGKTSTYGGGTTTSYSTINTSVAGWTHIGFASNVNTQSSSSSAKSLFDAGYGTIYGTFKKTETMTYYPQNETSMTGSQSVTNYLYGTGSTTNNIPTEPSLTYKGHSFDGWGTSSTGTPSSWTTLWNNGTRTVYAIWTKDGNVYFCPVNRNEWILTDTYYGAKVNGVLQWVPCEFKVGDGGWK